LSPSAAFAGLALPVTMESGIGVDTLPGGDARRVDFRLVDLEVLLVLRAGMVTLRISAESRPVDQVYRFGETRPLQAPEVSASAMGMNPFPAGDGSSRRTSLRPASTRRYSMACRKSGPRWTLGHHSTGLLR
jgi:hypothetical protein